jgi:hypothetical protein
MNASQNNAIAVPTKRAVTNIAGAWNKTIDALLDTANLLFVYSQQSNWREIKEQLQTDGVMGASVISMMLRIGRDPRLQKPAVKKLLPPSYNTLYLLTKLDDDVIDAKIKEDVLTPSLTVDEVRGWSTPSGSSKGATTSASNRIILQLPDKFSARDKSKLTKQLQELAQQYPGVKVQQ